MLSTTKSVDVEAAAAAVAAVVAEETRSVSNEEKEAQDVEAGGGDCPASMTWTQFVVAYKRLCRQEISFILSQPRKPFESTGLYKDMISYSSTTKEDLEREAADHEYGEDGLAELQERVRMEYAEKGFVALDDDEIAERLELEQYFNQCLREKLSEFNLDFGDD